MGRIIHFEIPADEPERAVCFYESAFNWKFQQWDGPMPYWLASTGPKEQPGIDGAIMIRQHPGQSVSNVIAVDSLEQAIEAVQKNGGEMITPILPIPGIGRYANARDTEGNVFGMMQPECAAAE
jgi:predicted enzyme related to lactoylglutathione lyase